MTKSKIAFTRPAVLAVVSVLAGMLSTRATAEPLREGIALDLDGRGATLKSLDTLPCVESDYTRRFKFDSYENAKLKELRARYHLDEVIQDSITPGCLS